MSTPAKERPRGGLMESLLTTLAVLAVYVVLMRYVLPRFGVPT